MTIRVAILFFACTTLIVVGSGCSTTSNDSTSIETGSIQQALVNISGSYNLVSVNGATVPATVAHGAANIKVHSGTFIIRPDGTCSSNTEFSPPSGGKVRQKVHASYSRNGSTLVMQWEGAGMTRGSIDDGTFTMDNHGMTLVYARSARSDDSISLDLENECATAIEKSRAGVFDDFNSGLQAGRNHDGIPLGFFTFWDSEGSTVSVSVTTDHPPRPGDEADNEVLQLDLNVKAWAGVIHNFEDAAVSRWTPRDWRGFNEFSFWMYGNNRNTSLFVEILDNRKPCPAAGGAEVYSYSFTDNFSGWKRISVAFEELGRKEIYNDAPNDGLGLAEVHGWAFGTLNTDGPITYYIDDFELR